MFNAFSSDVTMANRDASDPLFSFIPASISSYRPIPETSMTRRPRSVFPFSSSSGCIGSSLLAFDDTPYSFFSLYLVPMIHFSPTRCNVVSTLQLLKGNKKIPFLVESGQIFFQSSQLPTAILRNLLQNLSQRHDSSSFLIIGVVEGQPRPQKTENASH